MDNDRYDKEGWYSPVGENLPGGERLAYRNPQDQSFPRSSGEEQTPSGRTISPGRIAGLIIILLLAIAASSLALQRVTAGSPGTDERASRGDVELPESPKEFFDKYFDETETDSRDIYITPVEDRPSFTMFLHDAEETELTLNELYEQCAPSIVAISGYEKGSVGYNWGSGVVVTSDGIILTNTHVIDGCSRAVVKLDDDREYDAKLIGADAVSDVALLKIDAQGLKPAVFGESNDLHVGDPVAAIGNPLGESFRNTLTDGIISAIERGMTYHGRSMSLIQTNTAINEGNSGGALFNRYGQVVGITNMKMMSSYSSIEGIGFAIPSTTVCDVVNAIIQSGEVTGRPAIGITVGEIPDTAKEAYNLPDGLYVSAVRENSDAKQKGIQSGDIITAVNGAPVTRTSEVSDIINMLSVGDVMALTIWRDGNTVEIIVELMDTNDIY